MIFVIFKILSIHKKSGFLSIMNGPEFLPLLQRREQLPLWRIRSQTDIIECDLIPPQVATLGSLIGLKL